MATRYTYKLRPGYGSKDVLIEFDLVEDPVLLIDTLLQMLKEISIEMAQVEDFWFNDEVLIHLTAGSGRVTLSKDIWGLIFILGQSKEDQTSILAINTLLEGSELFEREEVDFSKYT